MLGVSSWSELGGIIALSLAVSGTAVLLSTGIGLPLGAWLGLGRFRGRAVLLRIVYTFMGLPPTVAGLMVFLIVRARGPLGPLSLIFTPTAMILAEVLLVTPIIAGLVSSAVEAEEKRFGETALMLGATEWQRRLLILRQARPAVFAAVITGLGRATAEVGAVMLVGGNIRFHTRVMTTAILLQTRRGEFGDALVLGAILLFIAFLVNSLVHRIQAGRGVRT